MAFTYNHLYKIKTTGLRFFTVCGPYGRPDMALFSFTKNILEEKTIKLFNNGKMKRDFTFVSDIVEGILLALKKEFDCEVFNLARGESQELIDFVKEIENSTGKTAIRELLPLQKGDVLITSANITKAKTMLGYNPKKSMKEGVKEFVHWYKEYYKY
jgi:UDP-glucuronate 4-epimerase